MQRISFNLGKGDLDTLGRIAKLRGMDRGKLITEIVEKYVQDKTPQLKALEELRTELGINE